MMNQSINNDTISSLLHHNYYNNYYFLETHYHNSVYYVSDKVTDHKRHYHLIMSTASQCLYYCLLYNYNRLPLIVNNAKK